MVELIRKISNHPITGQRRGIKLKQIAYIDFEIMEARIYWQELVFDARDEPIKSNLIPKRIIETHLSNTNKVNDQGITITEEYIKSVNPILEGETEEAYKERIEGLLKTALETGNLEFDFYVGAILNLQKIGQAVNLLDSLKRFDRE